MSTSRPTPAVVIGVLLGLMVCCFAFQGSRGLWEPDEGRYTAVADEMLRRDNWLEPHVDHDSPHWTKPPLTYWAVAASIATLGRSELAVRFPGALAYFLTILVTYRLGRLLLVRRPWLPALVYASFVLPSLASNVVTTDNLLALLESVAVLAFCQSVWGEERSRRAWSAAMWAAFGLAFLTKGPPALLPLIPIVLYARVGPPRGTPVRLHAWTGSLVFLAVSVPWFALVTARNPGLARYFLVDETVRRVATDYHERNGEWYGAFVVYLPTLFLGTLPWTWVIARSVVRSIAARVRGTASGARDPRQRFLALWFWVPVAVFALVRSRMHLYLLPSFVPLALLVACALEREGRPGWRLRTYAPWLLPWFLALLGVRVGLAHVQTEKDSRELASAFQSLDPASYDEIVFFELRARRGVGFYWDKEVEKVGEGELGDELREGSRKIWVVTRERYDAFEGFMAKRRKAVVPVGRVRDWYLVRELDEGEQPPAAPPGAPARSG